MATKKEEIAVTKIQSTTLYFSEIFVYLFYRIINVLLDIIYKLFSKVI